MKARPSEYRRSSATLGVLVVAFVVAGCRAPLSAQATDPFAAARLPDGPAAADAGAVVPASFTADSTTPGLQTTAPPGVSLPSDETKRRPPPSFSERLDKLSATNLWNGARNMAGFGTDESVARQAYAEGDDLFRQKRYAEAAAKYKTAARRWPDSILEEDAMFMRGQSLFLADQYSKASDVFVNLLKKYENSRYLDRVMALQFSIAQYWEQRTKDSWSYVPNFIDSSRPVLDPGGNAIAVYESIRLNDPTGPLADDAVMATATYHFVNGKYEDADYYYTLLRKEYPRSDHQPKAHLLGVQSKLEAYQGAQYEDSPLTEANKLIDNTLRQYGGSMPQERQRLIESKQKVRHQLAEREWTTGEYYYRRSQYRAARFHYQNITRDYPETAFSPKAQDRLKNTEGLPPEPPNRFLWLGRLFGETGDPHDSAK